MKICTRCCVEKPFSEFYKRPTRPSGYRSHCKKCCVEKSVAWREKNNVYVNKYQQDYRKKNGEAVREKARKYYAENKYRKAKLRDNEKQREYYRKQAKLAKKRHPEKNRAREAVAAAVRSGSLFRPASCSCCGENCKPEAHHNNGYEKDNWLDVVWLCTSCHGEEHRKDRNEQKTSS